MGHRQTDHRKTQNVNLQHRLINKLSCVTLRNGISVSQLYHQIYINLYTIHNNIVVVVLAPAVDKICESFTKNPLTRAQENPTFLSIMVMHKQCITNASKFESNFGGGSMDAHTLPWAIKNTHSNLKLHLSIHVNRVARRNILSTLHTETSPSCISNARIISTVVICSRT